MIRRLLFGLGVTLLLVGLFFVGYIGWMMWKDYQKSQQYLMPTDVSPSPVPLQALPEEQLEEPETGSSSGLVWKERPETGDKIGTLKIESIGVKLPIYEGISDKELSKGVGHHISTALPGEPDAVVLGGHREWALRKAGEIQEGDPLILETEEGDFTYIVSRMWVTDPDDRTVVVRTGNPILRLYTCFPFDQWKDPKKRYIIEAELQE